MKIFKGTRVCLLALVALTLGGYSTAIADYTATQGSGLTFASVVLAAKHYAAMLLCDATAGESQCAAVSASGQVAIQGSERWAVGKGQGLTWGSAFGTEVNSIVNGNAIISTISISNATALDLFEDVSFSIGSITSGAGAPYIGIYLYPLNQDGTTYGDGRFGSSAAGPPPSQYYACSIALVPSVTQVQTGSCRGILLPPGTFELVMYNQAGATMAASANTIKYRTYNRSLN